VPAGTVPVMTALVAVVLLGVLQVPVAFSRSISDTVSLPCVSCQLLALSLTGTASPLSFTSLRLVM